MADTPQFLGPDGVYRTDFVFSSTKSQHFFSGLVGSDTAVLEVSIRGNAFTADSELIVFTGTAFTLPNPVFYPNGLDLLPGENILLIRSIDTNGQVSRTAELRIYLLQESDITFITQTPSGISIERKESSVEIFITGLSDTNVLGYHLYAASSPGGGLEGYTRINQNLLDQGTVSEVLSELGSLTINGDVAVDQNGTPLADPLYFRIKGTQEDEMETVLQTDGDEVLAIDETVSKIRTSLVVSSVETETIYSFVHDRNGDESSFPPTIPNGEFASLSEDDPLYYVATAIYYDPVTQTEVESSFSPEVVGKPLVISTVPVGLPVVTRPRIIQDTTLAIYRSQPQVGVHAGTFTRDTFLDPFATEAERLRFVMDFLHQAQSFATLLEIDDPEGSGESIPVSLSPYKQALGQAFFLADDLAVQNVIDMCFEMVASRYGEKREAGKSAIGEVTISVKKPPAVSLPFPIGTVLVGPVLYRTTQAGEISSTNIASLYNASTGRYSVRLAIEAEEPGLEGNVVAGQINQFEGSFGTSAPGLGLEVTNEDDTFGGLPEETNRQLAIRVSGTLAGKDRGTLQGYYQTAIEIPGIEDVQVIGPLHPLMQRDLDILDTPPVHRGGKVDIWVKGEKTANVTDTFAFSFQIEKEVQFESLNDPADLIFRAIHPSLSEENPIIEMLNNSSWGYELKNVSSGHIYDLTDVVILTFNTIQLSADYNNVFPAITDLVVGDLRFRTSNAHIFTRQPVRQIESFSGTVTGEVDPDAYTLIRAESPLQKGRSTKAGDYLQLVEGSGVTVPSGDPITVSGEEHVIIGEYPEYLFKLGSSPLTVQVWDSSRTTLYKGPYDPSGSPDYTFVEGDSQSPYGIIRTTTGNLVSGQTILIDYQHDENFVVTYETNLLIQLAQKQINSKKPLEADVLVKEAIPVPIDLAGTILLDSNSGTNQPGLVGSRIQTALTNFQNSLQLGDSVPQANIIDQIKGVDGVSYPEVPLTKMVRTDNTPITRESILVDSEADFETIFNWSTQTHTVFLLKNSLSNATVVGGGQNDTLLGIQNYRGVFLDGIEQEIIPPPISNLGIPLNQKPHNAFIIGNDGLSIPGYSDDATLQALSPFISTEDRDAWVLDTRKSLTANRILVTLPGGISQQNNESLIINGLPQNLLYLDIYLKTVEVWDVTRTTKYKNTVDYYTFRHANTGKVSITYISGGSLEIGQTVFVDYKFSSNVPTFPDMFNWSVTYVVFGDTGAKSIVISPIEYPVINTQDFTYDKDPEA